MAESNLRNRAVTTSISSRPQVTDSPYEIMGSQFSSYDCYAMQYSTQIKQCDEHSNPEPDNSGARGRSSQQDEPGKRADSNSNIPFSIDPRLLSRNYPRPDDILQACNFCSEMPHESCQHFTVREPVFDSVDSVCLPGGAIGFLNIASAVDKNLVDRNNLCDPVCPHKENSNISINGPSYSKCPSIEPPSSSKNGSIAKEQQSRPAYRRHPKTEGGFVCQMCNKVFDRHRDLKRHQTIHHIRPFKCNFAGCDRSFAYGKDLRRHEAASHQSLRNFRCETCDASFTRRDNANRHVKKMHQCL